MDKMKMQTPDLADENFQKLAKLFPNAVTETIDENGEVTRAINADTLRQEINVQVIEGFQERYQFMWPNKHKAKRVAASPIAKTLRPCRKESEGFNSTENIYIEGDNLDVLKLLRETYLGRVKMIYIDPPYNTGNDSFVYDDVFTQTEDLFSEVSGQRDENGNILFDIRKSNESNGRFHTDWLNMMYPRLRVAKDMLKEDGVIFISIDDKELEKTKMVCNEIFGNNNFIGSLVLKTATDNNPSQINIEHEYMLCYAKSKESQGNWTRISEAAKRIINHYNELKRKGLGIDEIQKQLRKWININKDVLPQVAHYNCVDEHGVYSASGNSSNPHPGGYMYDILHPVSGLPCPKPKNGWRWPEKTFLEYNKRGEIDWGIDETTQPHVKKRIETAVEYLRSLIYEDNRATTQMLTELFDNKKVFDNPKPITVLKKIIDYVTTEESIVLDFFSGSASTAHAVMQLNSEDCGKRKFIMVQLPEDLDDSLAKADPIAKKTIQNAIDLCDELHRPHLLSEIGKERISRAGRKIREELSSEIARLEMELKTLSAKAKKRENSLLPTEEQVRAKEVEELIIAKQHVLATLDTGFRVFKLDSSNMKDVYYNPGKTEQKDLLGHVDNIKEDRTPEDLLFQVMLEFGIPLSSKIRKTAIAGKDVFNVEDNFLIACFDDDITNEIIMAIAKEKPQYVVLRDSGFKTDSVAANFEQIFATYSPDTTRRIL